MRSPVTSPNLLFKVVSWVSRLTAIHVYVCLLEARACAAAGRGQANCSVLLTSICALVCFRQPWYFLEMDEAVSEVWDEVLGAGLASVLRLIRGTLGT